VLGAGSLGGIGVQRLLGMGGIGGWMDERMGIGWAQVAWDSGAGTFTPSKRLGVGVLVGRLVDWLAGWSRREGKRQKKKNG